MARTLEIDADLRDGTAILAPSGDIDLDVSQQLRQALLQRLDDTGAVLVDMAGVGYIDSSGIAALIEAFQHARKRGLRFALARVPERAMRVIKIARLDRVFPILETLDTGFGGAG
jgi:anti-sigma B factor antagonist